MGEKLNKTLVQICKSLPSDLTLFEKDGKCNFSNNLCEYCVKYNNQEDYFCHKKTYTPKLVVSFA